MTVAKENKEIWNNIYSANEHLSSWPWTELVSLVKRYAGNLKEMKVLELGCGAGANIPFFLANKVDYYSIECSEYIVARLHDSFPSLSDRIIVGDFTKSFNTDQKFDLIIDRGSVTCCKSKEIFAIINNVYKHLNEGGLFIGIDWFSKKHSEFSRGDITDCLHTKSYSKGCFAGIGKIHFTDLDEIKSFFSKFNILLLQERTKSSLLDEKQNIHSSFDVVAKKG